jgi:transposase
MYKADLNKRTSWRVVSWQLPQEVQVQQAVLGIHIAKADFHAALLVDDSLRSKSFPNNPKGFSRLDAWLANRGVGHVHACLEATSSYGEDLDTHLADAGHTVSLVNPSRIKGYAQSELTRTKTDAVGAAIIALLQGPAPSSVYPARAGAAGAASPGSPFG